MAQSPFDFTRKRQDRDDALEFARLGPAQQAAFDMRELELGFRGGVQDATRSALGVPDVAQNREVAGQELKALAAKMQPGSAEFYKAAADIFRKYGMVTEAETMMERLRALEAPKAGEDKLAKLQSTYDKLLKRKAAGENVDAAIAAAERMFTQLGVPTKGTEPKALPLIELQARLRDPTITPVERKQIEDQITKLNQLAKTGGDGTAAAREARLAGKDEAKAKQAEEATKSALTKTAVVLGSEIRDATRLLNHPGVKYITGAKVGLLGRAAAAVSDAAAGANALLLNVVAQTFLRALQDLKATSSRGASGLGQLTEREGDKIQNAKAALDPQQPTEQFLRTLKQYLTELTATRDVAVRELQGVGLAAPPLPKVPDDGKAARDAAAVPTAAPDRAAPEQAAAPKKRTFKSRIVR